MAKWFSGFKNFKEQFVAGWLPFLKGDKVFKDEVTGKMEECFEPIPKKLKEYAEFWNSRQFNDDVNSILATIAKYISPEIAGAIVQKAKELAKVDKKAVQEHVENIIKTAKNIIKIFS